ncbi:MAG: hypothetical protein M0017_02510 [Desulfobacteraceae bacterium]|nr:hypothetical protein [Desulfobacteraceae bacterium]
MHRHGNGKWSCYLLAAALLLAPVAATAGSQPEEKANPVAAPELSNDDCIKCHAGPPKDIQEMGGAHRTKVSCTDCHQGHPPAVTDNIPKCSNCHKGKSHFELKGCLSCHSNPHKPLELTLKGNITEPCLTCHTGQITQLRENPSAHTKLACTTCHEKHGQKPECMKCHQPHQPEMTMADCTSCHKAHMPLQVTYGKETPSKQCAACHAAAYQLLTASHAKHSQLTCATCHQEKHGMVPKCADCHGAPHPEGMMAKFSKCGDCHGIAHNLTK